MHARRRVLADPAVVDLADRDDVEIIPAKPSILFHKDQTRLFENREMLHHGAAIELFEVQAEIARRPRAVLEEIEYPTPPRVGQSLEYSIVRMRP